MKKYDIDYTTFYKQKNNKKIRFPVFHNVSRVPTFFFSAMASYIF